jgi:hypothetical protein
MEKDVSKNHLENKTYCRICQRRGYEQVQIMLGVRLNRFSYPTKQLIEYSTGRTHIHREGMPL